MKILALSEKHQDTLMVLAGAVMISFSAVFVKIAHVGPTVSAFYRMAIGGVLLTIIALLTGRVSRFPLRSFGLMALCAFCFVWDLTVWHHSILYVGPGLATILANFQVFFLAGIGFVFFKERLNLRYVISVPLALLGLGLLILPRNMVTPQPPVYLGLGLGVLTLLVGGLLSLYASPLKDGLEHVLSRMGWTEGRAERYRTWLHQLAAKIQESLSFLPDYKWTSLSGILGATLTFLAVTGGLWLLLRSL
jgi:drug/metabolite transporter (DMT)-like permease